MAKGDKKRTYKLTDKSVRIIDWMEENSILEKSDFVDRAVKYYWAQQKAGNLNDPVLNDDANAGGNVPDLEGTNKDTSSILDRLRGKK
jgi:hypothetical protein